MANPLLDELNGIEDGGSSTLQSGYFCKAKLSFGFKVFATGISPEASLFEFDPFNKKTVEAALAKAKAFVSDNGVTSQPAKSIVLTLYRETVKGKNITWQRDLQKVVARWMPAYEKVWLPALEKLGINKPGEYWCHVALVNDPSGKTEKFSGKDGVERDSPSKVWVIDTLYPNEAVCIAEAAKVASTDNAGEEQPPAGFTSAIWKQYKPDIMKELADRTEDKLVSVSKNWNIPLEYLRALPA